MRTRPLPKKTYKKKKGGGGVYWGRVANLNTQYETRKRQTLVY